MPVYNIRSVRPKVNLQCWGDQQVCFLSIQKPGLCPCLPPLLTLDVLKSIFSKQQQVCEMVGGLCCCCLTWPIQINKKSHMNLFEYSESYLSGRCTVASETVNFLSMSSSIVPKFLWNWSCRSCQENGLDGQQNIVQIYYRANDVSIESRVEYPIEWLRNR